MGKHSIVRTAQGLAGTPAFKGVAAASVVGTLFGISSQMAVAAPQDDVAASASIEEVKAGTVDLSQAVNSATQDPNDSGWRFAMASVEVKEEKAQDAAEPQHAAEGNASTQNATPAVSTFVPPADGSRASTLVAAAMSGLGHPYVWGGASPAGWDCSGFTQWVYAQAGISLPHYGASQQASGTVIPASAAQPGDLISWGGGSHMAIYLGDGMQVGAMNPAQGTQALPVSSIIGTGGAPVYVRIP